MNCITNVPDSGCCINWIVKEGAALEGHFCHIYISSTLLFGILGHCVTAIQGFISLWSCNFILYAVFKLWVLESKRKFSFSGMMPDQAFYPQEISLEKGWEDRMSPYRITLCQTERNSQLIFLVPSGPTCGCGTERTWQRSHCVLQWNNIGLILSTWEGSLAEQEALTSWWYRWEQRSSYWQCTHVDPTANLHAGNGGKQ